MIQRPDRVRTTAAVTVALHHLAHAHNMLAHGKLVDPTGLMPAIKKHEKAAD